MKKELSPYYINPAISKSEIKGFIKDLSWWRKIKSKSIIPSPKSQDSKIRDLYKIVDLFNRDSSYYQELLSHLPVEAEKLSALIDIRYLKGELNYHELRAVVNEKFIGGSRSSFDLTVIDFCSRLKIYRQNNPELFLVNPICKESEELYYFCSKIQMNKGKIFRKIKMLLPNEANQFENLIDARYLKGEIPPSSVKDLTMMDELCFWALNNPFSVIPPEYSEDIKANSLGSFCQKLRKSNGLLFKEISKDYTDISNRLIKHIDLRYFQGKITLKHQEFLSYYNEIKKWQEAKGFKDIPKYYSDDKKERIMGRFCAKISAYQGRLFKEFEKDLPEDAKKFKEIIDSDFLYGIS